MAFKKKVAIEKVEPVKEAVIEPLSEVIPVKKVPVGYECVRKCFFNLRLWQDGERTPHIAGIENNHHFEPYF